MSAAPIELTVFTKSRGLLTKSIELAADGTLVSDPSECKMWEGTATRIRIDSLDELAALVGGLSQKQAISLGALRSDLPGMVEIATKKVAERNPKYVARVHNNLVYNGPAYALLDFDSKAMSGAVAAELGRVGGFWPALVSVLPALESIARVIRSSTSSELSRSDTGEAVRGSDGVHVYLAIKDGTDAVRFLETLHARCWLAGFGWGWINRGGAFMERSIVDRMVGASERLVFEGPPKLKPPLQQGSRRPVAVHGAVLDTMAACPPLSIVEQARFDDLTAKEKARLRPEMARVRDAFVTAEVKRLIARGKPEPTARKTVERWCEGVLLPDVVLEFDDEELTGCTVGDILADPERFEGATLADPIEGSPYGWCKAKVMRRASGQPFIHSFAHGRALYELRYDAESIGAALTKVAKEAVVATLAARVVEADIDAVEAEALRRQAHELSGAGLNPIKAVLKAAQQKQAAQAAKEKQAWRATQRQDPRPYIRAPFPDAPWLPQMKVINNVVGSAVSDMPQARDRGGAMTWVRKVPFVDMHVFTDANTEGDDDEEVT